VGREPVRASMLCGHVHLALSLLFVLLLSLAPFLLGFLFLVLGPSSLLPPHTSPGLPAGLLRALPSRQCRRAAADLPKGPLDISTKARVTRSV
jgi:hypothetical protein